MHMVFVSSWSKMWEYNLKSNQSLSIPVMIPSSCVSLSAIGTPQNQAAYWEPYADLVQTHQNMILNDKCRVSWKGSSSHENNSRAWLARQQVHTAQGNRWDSKIVCWYWSMQINKPSTCIYGTPLQLPLPKHALQAQILAEVDDGMVGARFFGVIDAQITLLPVSDVQALDLESAYLELPFFCMTNRGYQTNILHHYKASTYENLHAFNFTVCRLILRASPWANQNLASIGLDRWFHFGRNTPNLGFSRGFHSYAFNLKEVSQWARFYGAAISDINIDRCSNSSHLVCLHDGKLQCSY